VIIGVGGPLLEVSSDAGNDVVVASNFTAPSFKASLSGSGTLAVLAIFSPTTVIQNTG
jgi:hypothetical protein